MEKMKPPSVRSILKAMFTVTAIAATYQGSTAALAKEFPTQNVRIVLPFTPGAAVDSTARIIANKLSAYWKFPVIVENRPGGATTIGAGLVGQAAPDGHTLLFTISDTFTVTPHLANYKSFRPANDLVPVIMLAKLVNAIVVNPAVPFDSLPAMIDFARANPGTLRYGSAGPGTNGHLTMEVLKSLAKVDIQHVPYKGVAPAMTAALTGEVQIAFAGYSAKGLIDAGSVRQIVIAGPDRFPAFPKVPTTAEVGYPKVDSTTWLMLAAPTKTPKETIEAINEAIQQVLMAPDVRKELTEARGLVVESLGPAEAAPYLARLDQDHAEAVRISGADRE